MCSQCGEAAAKPEPTWRADMESDLGERLDDGGLVPTPVL